MDPGRVSAATGRLAERRCPLYRAIRELALLLGTWQLGRFGKVLGLQLPLSLAMYRTDSRPSFDDHEADFVGRLGSHLAEGLRTSLLTAAARDEAGPDVPGLVVLDAVGNAPRLLPEHHGGWDSFTTAWASFTTAWAIACPSTVSPMPSTPLPRSSAALTMTAIVRDCRGHGLPAPEQAA